MLCFAKWVVSVPKSEQAQPCMKHIQQLIFGGHGVLLKHVVALRSSVAEKKMKYCWDQTKWLDKSFVLLNDGK